MAGGAVNPFFNMYVVVHYKRSPWCNDPFWRMAIQAAIAADFLAQGAVRVNRNCVGFGDVLEDVGCQGGFLLKETEESRIVTIDAVHLRVHRYLPGIIGGLHLMALGTKIWPRCVRGNKAQHGNDYKHGGSAYD